MGYVVNFSAFIEGFIWLVTYGVVMLILYIIASDRSRPMNMFVRYAYYILMWLFSLIFVLYVGSKIL